MDGLQRKQNNSRSFQSGLRNEDQVLSSMVAHSVIFSHNKRRVIATRAIGIPAGTGPAQRTFDGVRLAGNCSKSVTPPHSQRKKWPDIIGIAAEDFFRKLQSRYSPAFAWKTSMMGALCLGMVSMALVYHYLGPQASAEGSGSVVQVGQESGSGRVLGEAIDGQENGESKDEPSSTEKLMKGVEQTALAAAGAVDALPQGMADNGSLDEETGYAPYFLDILAQQEGAVFEHQVRQMVQGYPIEVMVPAIVSKDRRVAAFLIGIARKESNWGKRVPVLNGKDCYNYWGYRGIRDRMGTGGHTCFDSPEDAVNTVAKRIERLIEEEDRLTPNKMVVWKCGYSCAGHSRQSVQKWISDVDLYFEKLNKTEE